MLRILQNREVERVGGSKSIDLDIRVIVATHRNLEQMIQDNKFREDLRFRLNLFPIFIPPLRQRREDIPALTRRFVRSKSRELGPLSPPAIAPGGALDRLVKYDWPGNVRVLQNVVEREIILLKEYVLEFRSLLPEPGRMKPRSLQQPELPEPVQLDEAMALHIGKVLAVTKGKIHGPGGAAQLLGINPCTLRSRMQKLGIKK